MASSTSEEVDWDSILSASSDEEDCSFDSEATLWQKGYWLGDSDTASDTTDRDTDDDEIDSPLLVEGLGVLASLESVVPDGRNILQDDDLPQDPLKRKTYYIAREIMTTERSFLKGLHLVEKAFHGAIRMHNMNIKEILPESAQRVIFSNIGAIYELSLELLIQLEQRIEKWEENPQVADIFVKRAPYLKMYSLYTADFEKAQAMLAEWMRKSPELVKIMKLIESHRICCGLTLPTYMLCPVQRVPRYRLLLQTYLKSLDEEHPDHGNTIKALALIEEAALHMEDQMKKLANFQQVVKIQRSLCGKGAETVVQPGREFLLKAPAKEAKRRGGKKQRVLFLFSDILVITRAGKTFGSNYKISSILQLRDVKVGQLSQQSRHLEATNTFSLTSPSKTHWFSMDTAETKLAWIKAIERATTMEEAKRNTFILEYSRLSASHLSLLLSDPQIQSELKRFAGPEPGEEQITLPSLQQRLRARLASVTNTYSPKNARKTQTSLRPVVELTSKPTHISETGHLDPTLVRKKRQISVDGDGEDEADGEDEIDGGPVTATGSAEFAAAVDEVDFVETLLSPLCTYVWMRRSSTNETPWKQVWCQLCGLYIYCFVDHQTIRQPFGCIPLAGYCLAEAKVAYGFGLSHPVKPTYQLKFDSEYDYDRWFSIINRDLNKYKLEELFSVQL